MLVVHASDLHLGRPLRALASHDTLDLHGFCHVGERALSRLVDLCLERKAQLLLIAGDLIDHWLRDYQLGLRLVRELTRLERSATRVFWVRGNHDAENRVIKTLLLPQHVSELGLGGAQTVLLDHLGIALTGASYPKRCTEENLFSKFPAPIQGLLNLGLLHTSADGKATGDRYAPCGRRELVSRGYQYVALGHVHEPEVISTKAGVAYSGCLQARNFAESGPRGCRLVEFNEGKMTSLDHHAVDVVRFGKVTVDVEDAYSLEDVQERMVTRCRDLLAKLPTLGLVIRVCFAGHQGLEVLRSSSNRLRSLHLRAATDALGERLSVDSYWAYPAHPDAPSLRLDDEQWVTRKDC